MWRTGTVRLTRLRGTDASSAGSRSVYRKEWSWQVRNIIARGPASDGMSMLIFPAVREDRMPGGRNSGAVYNMYPCKVGLQVIRNDC